MELRLAKCDCDGLSVTEEDGKILICEISYPHRRVKSSTFKVGRTRSINFEKKKNCHTRRLGLGSGVLRILTSRFGECLLALHNRRILFSLV